MSIPGAEDIEELADAIRESMYADDRQSRRTIDAGMDALNSLVAMARTPAVVLSDRELANVVRTYSIL